MICPTGYLGIPDLVKGSKVSSGCSCSGLLNELGDASPIWTLDWIIFLTVLDLPVRVIPNNAVRFPKKSRGETYTGTCSSAVWNLRLELYLTLPILMSVGLPL